MTSATVAVLDIGKSNAKLSACPADGQVCETLSQPKAVLAGPPWQHSDLTPQNVLALEGLAHFAASGPDADGTGLVLPMICYEQDLSAGLEEA